MRLGTRRVLVTGALGWLGRGLLHALTDGLPDYEALATPDPDVQIRGLDLASGRADGDRVELTAGDLRSPADCARFCDGAAGGIIHPGRVREFYEVNVEGTRNLLAAAAAAGVRRAVIMSSNSPCGCNPH